MEKIGAISAPGSVTETGPLDFAPLVDVLAKQSLHTYAGSLTTPPCAEGLTFFITTEQLPLNVATFNQIKAVVGFNARFTQNAVGQDNLLAASAKVVAQVEATAGGAEAVVAAPVAEAAPATAGGAEAVFAAPVAEAAPAAEVAKPAAEAAKPAVAEGAASVNIPSSSSSPPPSLSPPTFHSPALVSPVSALARDAPELETIPSSLSFWRKLELLTCISCLDNYGLQCHHCGKLRRSQ